MKNYIELSKNQAVSMSDSWYELADTKHFWAQWRFRVLIKICSNYIKPETKILEIGCGNGLVMKQFEDKKGVVIDGCDLNRAAFQDLCDVSGKVFLYDIYELNVELTGKYDIVILLDVLEHIENDTDFLITATKYIKDDGLIIVSVPAIQQLYSVYDKLIGHKRRYSKKEIRKLFSDADIMLIDCKYWGLSLLPLTFLRKQLLRQTSEMNAIKLGFKSPNKSFNWLMLMVMKLETFFFSSVIAGNSIIASGKVKAKK